MLLRDKLKFWMALSNYVDMIVRGTSPLSLPDAIANSLSYVKAFGGTEQRNIPQPYTQVNYVTNTAQTAVDTGIMIDFAKNYEFEVECRAVSGSWYILQSRASSSGNITGIHGATSGSTITLVVGNVTVCTSAITRTVGHKLYVKATLNNGTATLYVKDETANTEDTQTGSYGTSQPNPTAAVYLLGNAGGQYADVNSDIYMARIKENDTVVMDYVPARQVATAGFYDKASKTFKTALTPANLSAGGDAVPTPDYPLDIVSNNGVLKYRKPIMLDSTRYYAYLSANLTDWSYSSDSYSIPIPVTVGHKYKITVPTTNPLNGAQNVILRYAFADSINTDWTSSTATGQTSIPTYDMVRTTPQDTPSVEVTATHPYLIIQMGASVFGYILTNNLITITEQSIYTDGTVETINVHGKNLNGGGALDHKGYTSTGGTSPSTTFCGTLWKIKVSPGEKYTVSYGNFPDGVSGVFISTWLTDGTWNLRQAIAISGSYTYTVPAGVGEVNFTLYKTGGITIGSNSWLQIEKGETATEYEPYYDGGTATAEMLLKVGNYQDEQEILSGAITRNVGVKVLDGTESWTVSGNLFYADIATDALEDTHSCYCTHFKGVATNASASYNNEIKVGTNATQTVKWTRVQIYPVVGTYSDATAFKQYLADQYAAGTPVIIIYPLATPTTESVAGQTLQVQAGDNVLEITQASLNNLELESKYQKEA